MLDGFAIEIGLDRTVRLSKKGTPDKKKAVPRPSHKLLLLGPVSAREGVGRAEFWRCAIAGAGARRAGAGYDLLVVGMDFSGDRVGEAGRRGRRGQQSACGGWGAIGVGSCAKLLTCVSARAVSAPACTAVKASASRPALRFKHVIMYSVSDSFLFFIYAFVLFVQRGGPFFFYLR